jgi:hypothetical protein
MHANEPHKLLALFPSSDSCVIGTPMPKLSPSAYGDKHNWDYYNAKRQKCINDAINHLFGKRSLVLNPLQANGNCAWGANDNDRLKFKDFVQPEWSKPIFNFYASKSGLTHGFVFFAGGLSWPADVVQRLMIGWTKRLGWETNEIFPRHTQQNAPQYGCSINLPFFGEERVLDVVRYHMPLEEFWAHTTARKDTREAQDGSASATRPTNDESGYWWDDPLVAMLEAYKEHIPDFDFKEVGKGKYAVPCPGHPQLGGWNDGAKHSAADTLLSNTAVVYIRNDWPKFECLHEHCLSPKKTINDWRRYFDPDYVVFDINDYIDDCAERGYENDRASVRQNPLA